MKNVKSNFKEVRKMYLRNIFSCKKPKINSFNKKEEHKIMRWLIKERQAGSYPLFTPDERFAIKVGIDYELRNEKLNYIYPEKEQRNNIADRMTNEVRTGIGKILDTFNNIEGDLPLQDLRIPAKDILPLALKEDEAQKELETYMDNIVKGGRTTLTEVEYEKYKELKSKVDNFKNARYEKLRELEKLKQANKELVRSKDIEEEYNFLFTTEPISEDFLLKYFPSLKD